MRYYAKPLVSSLFLVSAVACGSPPAEPVARAQAEALTARDAVAPLVALLAPESDGGAALTAAEAAAYVAEIASFDADSSIDALAVLPTFRDPDSAPQVSAVTLALRTHVSTLRVSGLGVDGLTLSSCGDGVTTTATFDPLRAPYARVTLVYSGDGWATSHAVDLPRGADGLHRATLPGIDPNARVTFAFALTGPDGRLAWLNNPRENSGKSSGHIDFSVAVGRCGSVATPKTPQLARFVRALTRAESDGGATVTWDEMSALVAYTTYDGGPGMDAPDAIDPALAELAKMANEGVAFEGSTQSTMTTFLTQMRMRTATSPALRAFRTDPGYVLVTPTEPRVEAMRIWYSTDGWSTPKTADCSPLGRAGLVNCDLGYLPKNTLVAYSAWQRFADGHQAWIHAADGGNLFQAVP